MRLGPGGRVVHAEHPGRVALPEAQSVGGVVGVDRGRQAVAVAVRERYGLVEVRVRGDADDGAEGLGAVELVVRRHAVNDGRVAVEAGLRVADEVLARVIRCDPADPGRSVYGVLLPYEVQPAQEPLLEALAEHWAVEYVLRWISDGSLLDRPGEAGEEIVVHGLVDDHRAERGASLAGRAEAGEQRAFGRQIQVRVGHDDERILAAELQARRLQVSSAELPNPAPDLRGAGEADFVHEPHIEGLLEALESDRSLGLDDVEDAFGEAAVEKESGQGVADGGSVLGGFPDHRIAAVDRGDQVPGRDRHREVSGGDDGRDSHRHPEGEELLVGHLARNVLAVEPAALTGEEVAGIHNLLHLAQGFSVGFADLACYQTGQSLLVRLDDAPDLLHGPRPYRGGDG